jgi:phage terminase large subunit-like protein
LSIVWDYRVPGKDLTLQSLADSDLSMEEIGDAFRSLTLEQLLCFKYDWARHARSEQLPPEGDWQKWLYLGGRGAGKTRSGAEWIRASLEAGCSRLALVAPTAADARDIMVLGESGILAWPQFRHAP